MQSNFSRLLVNNWTIQESSFSSTLSNHAPVDKLVIVSLLSPPHPLNSLGNGVSYRNIYQFHTEEDAYHDNQPLLTTQDDEINDENLLFSYKGKPFGLWLEIFEFLILLDSQIGHSKLGSQLECLNFPIKSPPFELLLILPILLPQATMLRMAAMQTKKSHPTRSP